MKPKIGKYYDFRDPGLSTGWIIRVTRIDDSQVYCDCISGISFTPDWRFCQTSDFEKGYHVQPASQEQINHIYTCIVAGQFVTPSIVIENYQLY